MRWPRSTSISPWPAGVNRVARTLDRGAALAVVAAREAVASAGLDVAAQGPRVAVSVASSLGGLAALDEAARAFAERGARRVSPYLATQVIGNAAAAAVSLDLGARGAAVSTGSACASGSDALGAGLDALRLRRADAVLAGGADTALVGPLLAAFTQARAHARGPAPDACRPFAADRDGFVAGEGAAVLVLERAGDARARGATVPLAVLAGHGAAADAHHVTSPDPRGPGAGRRRPRGAGGRVRAAGGRRRRRRPTPPAPPRATPRRWRGCARRWARSSRRWSPPRGRRAT